MSYLTNYKNIPACSSKDQSVPPYPENPSVPPAERMTGGLNVPCLPPFPDKTGKKSAKDEDCDKNKEDETCDNKEEEINIGSKQKARAKKIKKARIVTDEATIVPMVIQGFPWFNKPEYNCEDSIYHDLYNIDRSQADCLKKNDFDVLLLQ